MNLEHNPTSDRASDKSKLELVRAKLESGNLLQERGEIAKAIATYQSAIALMPDIAEIHLCLASLLGEQGQIEAAIASCQTAIDLNPDLAQAHLTMANLLGEQGQTEAAISSCQAALDLKLDLAEAYLTLANLLQEQGQTEAAIAACQTALELNPDDHFARLSMVITQLPSIHSDTAEIELRRSNYQHHLKSLTDSYLVASPEERAEAAEAVGSSQPFYLAYQGLCDRDLQQTYGNMIHLLMASRYPQWSKPLAMPQLNAEQKIRIGFVSGFFRDHSVWKIPLKGWIENLDFSEFELFGYYTETQQDPETAKAAQACQKFEMASLSVEQWAEKIAADQLHALIFPEFGMDSMTLQLGCLRLAPVQIAFGGHPETSGLPTIDYHLSSDLMEPPNAQEHYTEELIGLPNLAVCYHPIPFQPEATSKKAIAIAEDEIMFWCCQSLFKYLPEHDDIFPRIARELANSKFVFIEHEIEFATNIFRQRLARAFEEFELDYQDYCIFLPRLDSNRFVGFTAIADVFLDNIGWSGNNTTMESTAFDLPIVTLPGNLMRARHTMAILKMMGITETIAENKEEYVRIAVRLGKDSDYRQHISQKIALNKHKLYKDLKPVRAIEDFLFEVFHKPRKYSKKIANAFQLAVRHHRANRFEAAQQQYIKVLEAQPNHPEALYGMAMLAKQVGELEAAEQYLIATLNTQPHHLKAWFDLGNLYQSQRKLAAAERAYQQALSLRTDSAPIYNNLGYVLQQQDKWEEAAVCYNKALEIQPNCTEAEVNWANALFALGKLSAKKQLHYAELNYKLGLARQRVKDWQTAVLYYRQAILIQPELVDARYHLGLALQQQRQLTKAIACYQQVLQLKPSYGEAYYNLGKIYQDLGDLSSATVNFKEGLKLTNSNYAEALESERQTSFEDNFTIPQIPQGEVTIGAYQFPVIPALSALESTRPFWSVVIPVVNRPEYFPECLASILAQWNEEDMEIIVLDNGSEPPQWKIPNELGKGIIRYYRFPKTVSIQENWNTAVSLCRGKWIHLLHHDDCVLPEFYTRLKASLAICPETVGAAFTGYENIDENRRVIFSQQHNLENYRGIVRDWVMRIGVSCPLSPPSVVIRRAAYERVGGYKLDLPYTCDWEFYKRVATFYDWWYEPGILAHYREQTNSITIAENINGSSGIAHRRAIEISDSYLPEACRAEIAHKSRAFHFEWCLDKANIPLEVGNVEGAMCLIREALKLDRSPQAIYKLSLWLQEEPAASVADKLLPLVESFNE